MSYAAGTLFARDKEKAASDQADGGAACGRHAQYGGAADSSTWLELIV